MVVMTGNVLKVRGLFQDSYIIVTGLTSNRFYPMFALSIYYTSGSSDGSKIAIQATMHVTIRCKNA